MPTDGSIDYSDYTLPELHQALGNVNRERYPRNAQMIDHWISVRKGDIPPYTHPPASTTKESKHTKTTDEPFVGNQVTSKGTVRFFYAWVNYFIIFFVAFYSFQFVSSFMVVPLFEFGLRVETALIIFKTVNFIAAGLLSFFVYRWSVNKYLQPQFTVSSGINDDVS